MPPPTAFATATPPVKRAAKLKNAAHSTAAKGLSTRVPTIVAIEFAESWNPLLKSKTNATPMIAMTYQTTRSSAVLDGNAVQRVRHTHALVDRNLERFEHFLPANYLERIGTSGEESTDCLVIEG